VFLVETLIERNRMRVVAARLAHRYGEIGKETVVSAVATAGVPIINAQKIEIRYRMETTLNIFSVGRGQKSLRRRT
jgi:hypothetical protein